MSTYAEMSYDELSAYMDSDVCEPMEWGAVTAEQERKSAVMTALVELAAEMDAEGWVLVPRRIIGKGLSEASYPGLFGAIPTFVDFEASPPLTREA